MAKSVLAVLAEGFEEIEAITPVDVLRRLDVDVTVASLDGLVVKGARGISVQADTTLAEVAGRTFDLIVLPGGMPGAANLAASSLLGDMLKKQRAEGRMIAAICAAPAVVLHPLGLLGDEKTSCYPAFQRRLDEVVAGHVHGVDPVHRRCGDQRIVARLGPTRRPAARPVVERCRIAEQPPDHRRVAPDRVGQRSHGSGEVDTLRGEQVAGDDQALDLLGPLEDVENLGVACPLLNQLGLAVAQRAGELDAAKRHLVAHSTGLGLGHRRFHRVGLAVVSEPGRLERQQQRRFPVGFHRDEGRCGVGL